MVHSIPSQQSPFARRDDRPGAAGLVYASAPTDRPVTCAKLLSLAANSVRRATSGTAHLAYAFWPRHTDAAAVFLVALIVRLAHVWAMRRSPFVDALLGDSRSYVGWGHQIAAGDLIGQGVFYQAPLYAYFLGAIYACRGGLVAVRVCQAIVGAGSCLLLQHATARLYGRAVGLAAGLMLAFYAPAIFFGWVIQKSVLDLFMLSLLLALLAGLLTAARTSGEKADVGQRGRWLMVGVVSGLLSLTRENALVFVPVMLAWIWWDIGTSKSARLTAAGLLIAGVSLVLLPVALRNAIVGGEFHLTTAQSGPNFFIGNHAHADGTYVSLRPGRGSPEYEQADASELAVRTVGRSLSAGEISSYWTGLAVAYIRSHPIEWLRLEARKFRLLWNGTEIVDTESQESHEDYSPPLHLLARVARFGVLVPLALIGAWISWSERRRLWLLPTMMGAYASSVLAFYVVARYRLPLVPFLTMFAALAVVRGRAFFPALTLTRIVGGLAALTVVTVWCNVPVVSADAMRVATYQNLGAAFQETGRLHDAEAAFTRALALDPDSAPAHSSLGSVLRQQGRPEEAIEQLELALRLQPNFDDARFNLANARADLGDWTGAIAAYEQVARRRPDSVEAHANLAIALAGADRLDEAIEHFRTAAALAPQTAKAHYNLGHALLVRGDVNEAVDELIRAERIDPNDGLVHYELGNAHLVQQRFADAEREFRETVRLLPRSAEGHNELGITLGSLGRLDEAAGEFETAVRINPAFEQARANLRTAQNARRPAAAANQR